MAAAQPPLIIPMTPFRTTLFLAVIFAGLGVYVYTIEVPTMEQDARQETEAQRLLPFDYRDVTHLAYTTRTEQILMSRDERNRWRIVEPVEARGDAREIESVLRALEIGKISRIIQEKGQEQDTTSVQYGLQAPYVTIDLTTPEYTESLALGNTGPLSSTLYAQRGSDRNILLTTLMVGDFRAKNPGHLSPERHPLLRQDTRRTHPTANSRANHDTPAWSWIPWPGFRVEFYVSGERPCR